MSKPSWDDAPEWAQYLAQDVSGTWYWFERKPGYDPDGTWICRTGDCVEASSNESWADTLEHRP